MNILEKRFEDWICDNITEVVFGAEVVGRQLTMPNGGVLDVLARHTEGDPAGESCEVVFTVIEVKKEVIDESAVVQVLSYMGSLSQAISKGWKEFAEQEANGKLVTAVMVRGVVAAPEITNRAANVVLGTCGLVRYVNLGVNITAREWTRMRPGDTNEGMLDGVASIIKHELGECAEARVALREIVSSGEEVPF